MSDQLPTYRVNVFREDELWVAIVEGLRPGATDVEHFSELEDAVSDLIAGMTDTDIGDFWIDWSIVQGSNELAALVHDLRQWERQADTAQANRDRVRQAAVEAMKAAGLSYREIADAIGVSHQRIGQLLNDPGPAKDKLGDIDIAWIAPRLHITADLRHSHSSYVSPADAALVWIVENVMQAHPERRHDLLMGAASALEDVANDDEFLRSGGKSKSA